MNKTEQKIIEAIKQAEEKIAQAYHLKDLAEQIKELN